MNKSILQKSVVTLFALAAFSCDQDDEPTTNTAPVIAAQTFNASETTDDTNILAKVAATDADGDALTFSLKTNSNNLFEITDAGDISLASGKTMDFETAKSHTLSIDVSDGDLTSNATITINVSDLNDNPIAPDLNFTSAEDITDTVIIGIATATDEDGDALSFSIETDVDDLFEISSAGEISLQAGKNLDFETKTLHTVTLEISDGGTNPVNPVISITVTDVVENTTVTVTTVAGSTQGRLDDSGTAAQFDRPYGVAIDSQGNLFVADRSNGLIRKINTAGVVSTFFSGSRNAVTNPTDLVFDSNDNLYFTDNTAESVFKINTAGVLSTLVSNVPMQTDVLDNPIGIAVDSSDNIFIVDSGMHLVLKITPAGAVSIFAGNGSAGYVDGSANTAQFDGPSNIAIDSNDNVFISEFGNDVIRKIDTNTMVSTFAGSPNSSTFYADGTGTDARFGSLTDLVFDTNDNLYVVDSQNQNIRKITPNAEVVTFAGPMGTLARGTTDGPASTARFNVPWGITTNTSGTEIYIGDSGNHRIRKITIQ